MAKRYYKVDEMVWVKPLKKKGKVVSLNIPELKAKVTIIEGKVDGKLQFSEQEFGFTDIDKLRVADAGQVGTIKRNVKRDVLLFAKVKPDAIIPSKRHEDAGYDLYANFDGTLLVLQKGVPTLVPTGIASSFSPKYYLNCKHERGSTGKIGLSLLSGVVDSGYRGEIFVNLVATNKDVIITKDVDKVVELPDHILYPYSKAIVQATLDIVPNVVVKEISYEELSAIPSERAKNILGSSGK